MPSSKPAPTIRVALVEDDPVFRDAVSAAIAQSPDLQLTVAAASHAEAMRMLDGPRPDVLLTDLGLPDGSGVDVISAAQGRWPGCVVMVATTFGDEANVMQSIEAGAVGYLLKDSSPAEIVEEIRSLHGGGSPISPLIARQILRRFRTEQPAPAQADSAIALSPREREVLLHVTKGFSYDEIGRLLGVSRYTVQSFVRRIYAKLDVNSKVEAIYEARKQGLLP